MTPNSTEERAALVNDLAVKITEHAIMELDADEENTLQIEAFGNAVEREILADLPALTRTDNDVSGLVGWQPIETAPKDGSAMWLYDPEHCDEEMNPSLSGHWTDSRDDDSEGFVAAVWNNCQDYFATVAVNPTHWTPQPEAPALAKHRQSNGGAE